MLRKEVSSDPRTEFLKLGKIILKNNNKKNQAMPCALGCETEHA